MVSLSARVCRAKVPVFSPCFYVHGELAAGAKAALPAEYPERAAYVAAGPGAGAVGAGPCYRG